MSHHAEHDAKVCLDQRIIDSCQPKIYDDQFYVSEYLLSVSDAVNELIQLRATVHSKHQCRATQETSTIPFPPSLEAAEAIVAKLDALREETQRLESIYQQKLAALDALKKSLLHQAFTGQL